jgi:pyruvate dehydrogenase E2 component (dihydrolipoamide acetyltransferase)
MAYKIVMPQLGLTMEEGSVTSWLKTPGEWVDKGDPLFIVETDKIEMEVESMGKGYLGPIQVENGQKVLVGTLLAMLNDEKETAA